MAFVYNKKMTNSKIITSHLQLYKCKQNILDGINFYVIAQKRKATSRYYNPPSHICLPSGKMDFAWVPTVSTFVVIFRNF